MLYRYESTLKRVIDGDTIVVTIDLGFNIFIEQHIRLLDIDAPEVTSKSATHKEAGLLVKSYLEDLLQGTPITLESQKPNARSFNRYLAHIYAVDAKGQEYCVNEHLLEKGYVQRYINKIEPWETKDLKRIVKELKKAG